MVATMTLPLSPTAPVLDARWFSEQGCVVHYDDLCEVFVGGTLVGEYEPSDLVSRNVLMVHLSKEPRVRKGKLAAAFGVTTGMLRRVTREVEERGIESLFKHGSRGRPVKVTAAQRRRLFGLFDEGVSIQEANRRVRQVGYGTVWRLHQEWKVAQEASSSDTGQVELLATGRAGEPQDEAAPADNGASVDVGGEEGIHEQPLVSAQFVQHAGSWLMLGMLERYGLYTLLGRLGADLGDGASFRVVIDAVIIALSIGQRCVEGVRRLATPTASVLLRADHAPSESWSRRVLKDFVAQAGSARLHLAFGLGLLRLARTEADEPAVYYVDNHMRPYTGKHTVRKGWRMQDKRALPGATDYYVHDEDGRPALRVDVPSHASLTQWLSPIGGLLRQALGKDTRILLAFDRAGAYPENLSELRNAGFEFVTYERRPYPMLADSAFDQSLELGEETVQYHESRKTNLGKGRGRVRRIVVKMEDGQQVNLLAISAAPAARLIEIMDGRWCQENAFKHGVERWGINQLDQRKVREYPPGTVIPNPARSRLDRALRVARVREGEARRQLSRLDDGEAGPSTENKRKKWGHELELALDQQRELESLRPGTPKHAPVEETELAGKLAQHEGHIKTVIDTLRIACANAESDLAAELAAGMRRPKEAKKALANLLTAPGHVRVNGKSITVKLMPAATSDESMAIGYFLEVVNRRRLVLPADPERRALRFRT